MTLATVSAEGHVVIPAEIRRKLGIGPGTELEFTEEGGQLRVRVQGAHPQPVSDLDDGFGMLRYIGPPRRLADFDVAAVMREQHRDGR